VRGNEVSHFNVGGSPSADLLRELETRVKRGWRVSSRMQLVVVPVVKFVRADYAARCFGPGGSGPGRLGYTWVPAVCPSLRLAASVAVRLLLLALFV